MYRIMYMSTATRELGDKELEDILEKAQNNNSQRNITGLLLIKGRTFLQCLEGKKDDVLYIYEKIQKDDRHIDIIDLIEENAEERYFPNWSMGYKNIKYLTNIKSKKLIDFANDEITLSENDISEVFEEFIKSN